MIAIETGYVPVDGGALYYEVAGQGPAMVLVHAGVADHRMWDEQFTTFAERYRVVRYDTRGYGQTRTQVASFSDRKDLADLLGHLGIEKAAIVGVSRGGAMAVDFTLEYPLLVTALLPVAAGLSGFDLPPAKEDASLDRQFEAMEAAWKTAMETRDFGALVDLEVRMWADGPGQPEGRAPQHVREKVRQMCLDAYRIQEFELTPVRLDPPAAGRLDEIGVPALILAGDLDTRGVLLMADAMAAGIPDARKIVFPGVAHMIPMEIPEQFNAPVLAFLKNVLPA